MFSSVFGIIHLQSGFMSGRSAGRSTAKEFAFDYSYWSVDNRDEHYTSQEMVSWDRAVRSTKQILHERGEKRVLGLGYICMTFPMLF